MGQRQCCGIDGVRALATKRMGTVAISGRCHKLPKRLQDDYVMQKTVLGSGYNGKVYQAIHRETKKAYAVKSFKLHGVSKEQRKDVENELLIFLCMDHPNVARLVDVYESEDSLSLVMECMSGGELFQRVTERKRFTEKDACDATWQMLLAVSYIHSHSVVHRDIKLENWMFESKGSDHLKLIDFGFSKIWPTNTKMATTCGTLAYVAPEVLNRSYTSQCDLWSLGVTVFIMVFGYLPFYGYEDQQVAAIRAGQYKVKKEVWNKVSVDVQEFVKALLVVDPIQRLTAQSALEHRWIRKRDMMESKSSMAKETTDALVSFAAETRFRRAALHLMAWSLTNEERAQVQQAFIDIDTDRTGSITLKELKQVMDKHLDIDSKEMQHTFDALHSSHHDEIFYSEFLAAMISTRIQIHDHLLHESFKRFDADDSGFLTQEELELALDNESFPSEVVSAIIKDLDTGSCDGKISYAEFAAYFRNPNAKSEHQVAAVKFLDKRQESDVEQQDSLANLEPENSTSIHKMINDQLPCCGLQ
mmetsp:Transcript_77193/g.153063  ORF Transcript_77193/g.153063 Transcript_77193/m.153063 type:complete len:531 (+) Transcript_77193:41-1633(+)